MPTIDDKVVAISFENSKFESGVNKTISALDKLKNSLKGMEGGKAFNDLDRASKQVQLGHIAQGVDSIRQKLGFLSVAALAVFAQIAQRAVAAGAQLVKSLTIEPLIAGFREYTINLNSIQTILGNTKASGADLQDVNAALQELNRYSDKTIYNFAEMARNIGTFTAAGVALKPATAAIKGIANLAALSGSNSQQASTAMYQLSQAIAAGRVSLMDWNSVVNAGMGGTVFQRALAQTAVTMGELPKSALKLVGPMKNVSIHGQSFRQSMMAAPGKQSWLTSDVLTKTLAQFTGDMTDAELAAQGFNKAQIKAIQTQAQMAMHAATQVKTLTQVIDVAKETAGSGWAQTWQIIFGDFGEARTTFTNLSNAINSFINASANARNSVLRDWKELGGRTVMIDGIKTAFQALGMILRPIKQAFRDIFPARTGKDLYDLTVRFKAFAEALKPSPETIRNLHRTFAGLFAVMDIGKQIMGGILGVFGRLFGILLGGSGSFLEITGSIGDFFVALDKALREGEGLEKFFDGLTAVLAVPIKLFQKITEAVANMFSGFSPGGFSVQMDAATKAAEPFKKVLEVISQALQGLGPAISNAVSNMNFDAILAVINTGLFAAIVLMIRKFIGGTTLERVLGLFGSKIGGSFAKNLGGGILKNLSGAFGGLTGTLSAMQAKLKAQTLESIAIAIALLTASVVALSFVDPKRVNASLSAMALMFGELIGAMMLMDKVIKGGALVKLPIIAGSLIMLATAIDILTIAVFTLSKLSWSELIKGLGAVAALLGTLVAVSGPLGKNAPGMIRAGIAIGIIAVSLNIMALAVKQLGSMDLSSLVKGLGGIAGSLGAVAAAMKVMPRSMVMQAAALVVIATALNILAQAVGKFGAMNLITIGKGLLGVSGGLVAIAAAMRLMPKNMLLTSTGLLLVATSLGKVVDAVQRMGGMTIEKIAKGLGTLAGSLIILAAGLHAMSGTIGGAVALTLAAAGLSLLAPALVSLGRQSWTSVIKSLISLAAALGLIAGASLVLSSAIPAMLGFGAALVLIGGGLALAGAGIALIGVGLSAIAVAGPTAIGILINALIDLTEAIPKFAKNLVLGLLAIVKAFAATAPQFVAAMVKIVDSLAEALIKSSPKIAEGIAVLIQSLLVALASHSPQIIQAGFDLLLNLLKGIQQNIVGVVTMVGKIIVTFLNAVASKLGSIVRAGFNIVSSLIKGIIDNIGRVISAAASAVAGFIGAIAKSYGKIIAAGATAIIKFVSGIANNIGKAISAGANLIANFVVGIGNAGARIVAAGTNAIIKFINALSANSVRLANAGATAIINFLNGMARVIEQREPEMIAAGMRIGKAIVLGMIKGLLGWAPQVYNKAREIGGKVLGFLGKAVGLGSPSKLTAEMGMFMIEGFVIGLDKNSPKVYSAAQRIGTDLISMFNTILETNSPSRVTERIGRYVAQGFANGLKTGLAEDVTSAFSDLRERLTNEIKTIQDRLIEERKKLKELQEHPKANAAAINAEQTAISRDQATLAKLLATQKYLTSAMKDERKELLKLANDYEKVGEKLAAAKDVLAEAIQTRDEAAASYKEQYSELPEFSGEGTGAEQLTAYLKSLADQAAATAKYKQTLDKLRALGLDDATYQKLLSEGTKDQAVADALLAGGKAAVDNINKLDANLNKQAEALAKDAAKKLYQAGVDAAQGIVDGLTKKQKELAAAMDKIADELVKAIKRKLKVRSPSQVFAEIGARSMDGLAKGFAESTKKVISGVEQIADSALSALQKSMSNAGRIMSTELSSKATITPILDLSKARDQAGTLGSLFNIAPITADVSLGQAKAISSAQNVSQNELEKQAVARETLVKFEQNNYSPEALSEIEIYRQTRNQLSQLKSLVVPA